MMTTLWYQRIVSILTGTRSRWSTHLAEWVGDGVGDIRTLHSFIPHSASHLGSWGSQCGTELHTRAERCYVPRLPRCGVRSHTWSPKQTFTPEPQPAAACRTRTPGRRLSRSLCLRDIWPTSRNLKGKADTRQSAAACGGRSPLLPPPHTALSLVAPDWSAISRSLGLPSGRLRATHQSRQPAQLVMSSCVTFERNAL